MTPEPESTDRIDTQWGMISHVPVPFAHQTGRTKEGHPAFVEHMNSDGLSLTLCALVMCLFVALFVFLMFFAASSNQPIPPDLAVMTAVFMLLAGFIFWIVHQNSTTARRLVLLERTLELAIQTVRTSGRVVRESRRPLSKCELSIHAVALRSEKFPVAFSGWMACIRVGEDRFTLACCKTEAEVLAYVQRLPPGLLAISTGVGKPVNAFLLDRRFGNRSRVIKP